MNDPQRDLVYAMERLELGGHWRHRLPTKIGNKWVRHACKHLQVDRPKVIVKTVLGRRGEYNPGTSTIVLDPGYGRSGIVLLHELAHHITYARYPRAQDHGPRWMLVYAILLDMARLVPMAGTRAACKRHGVKIARKL